ncbi:MAG: hypothetical protein IPP77_05880 [Bacteroidetes bacterium]|nr:hypothetical protein [Bacteroidota bacterium]
MRANVSLLTIQKFVSLLDDFHFEVFIGHLADLKAVLPEKLVKSIRKKLPDFHTPAELCTVMYGNNQTIEKRNFNQLTAHTFRLSAYLSRNYPSYLLHNISLIEQLINKGQLIEAQIVADNLLDISGLVEDFHCEIRVLKILAQQAFLTKDIAIGFQLNSRLKKAYENEANYQQIILSLRKTFYQPDSGHKPENLKNLILFYKKFQNDVSASIRIVSKYAHIYSLYYYNPGMFDKAQDLILIKSLEKDLRDSSYVVFHFLLDIKGVLGFLVLNSSLIKSGSKEGEKFLQELHKHFDSILFWKHFLNVPLMFLIAIRASEFLSRYHFQIHRVDYHDVIRPKDLATIESLITKTGEVLQKYSGGAIYKNDIISLRMLYGSLLIFSGGKNVSRGIKELESLLLSYQQINLSGSTDSVFLSLMVGYFSIGNYEKCNETFRRYQKTIKNKPIYEGNDISIHTYYYLAKWLSTQSVQYLKKLEDNYKRTSKDEGPRRAMDALISYFKVPVRLKR